MATRALSNTVGFPTTQRSRKTTEGLARVSPDAGAAPLGPRPTTRALPSGYPGIGSPLVSAVTQKNLPVLQAISVMVVFAFAFSNLVADFLYGVLNPRVRLG